MRELTPHEKELLETSQESARESQVRASAKPQWLSALGFLLRPLTWGIAILVLGWSIALGALLSTSLMQARLGSNFMAIIEEGRDNPEYVSLIEDSLGIENYGLVVNLYTHRFEIAIGLFITSLILAVALYLWDIRLNRKKHG